MNEQEKSSLLETVTLIVKWMSETTEVLESINKRIEAIEHKENAHETVTGMVHNYPCDISALNRGWSGGY